MRTLPLALALFALGCGVVDSPEPTVGAPATGAKADNPVVVDTTLFDHYAALAREAGAELAPGTVTVVGLRGSSLDGTLHDTQTRAEYDDTLAVLTADGQVVELPGSTHPFETRHDDATDADGDGAGDVGLLRPGRYQVVARPAARNIAGRPTYHVRTVSGSGSVPGWRDTDHDGVYTDDEKRASETRNDALTAILFHPGGPDAPSAIGCQVVPPDEYERFVAAVGGSKASFTYLLLDAGL